MKRLINLISIVLLALIFSNCNKENYNPHGGNVKFSLNLKQTSQKSVSISDAERVVVSITDIHGVLIYDTEIIELINFNGFYISKPIALKPGNYKLTQFHVMDKSGKVIYSSPLEGSNKAYLVGDPLPLDFEITKDNVTKLSPEVLSVENCVPSEFGYSTFTFNIVETLDFLVSVFIYNPEIKNFELTSAFIKVTSNDTKLYSDSIKAITNKITIRAGSNQYKIEISKPFYETYIAEFTIDSLKTIFDNPLIVVLNKNESIPGLIAYYPFTGNANDESGNGNHGANHGASLVNDIKGNENSAYSFNGISNYIELNQAFDLEEGTFSIWIKARTFPVWDYPSDPSMSTFFGTDNPNLQFGGFSMNVSNRNNINMVFVKVGYFYGDCEFEAPIEVNKWNHIVLTKDVNYAKVYLNGNSISKKNMNNAVSIQGSPHAIIGSSRMKNNRFFDGNMDEIRIYNRVLSEQEIKVLNSIQ